MMTIADEPSRYHALDRVRAQAMLLGVGRLADSAFWAYLVHQPLVLIGLAAARPLNLTW